MKVKLLITGLLCVVSAATFAQKGELNNAQTAYDKYDGLRGGSIKLAMPSLLEAKTSIDKAAVNEKTANMPKTLALKGAIYSALALQDSVETTSLPNFKIADESLKKAKSLDSAKQENKALIDNAYRNLVQYEFNNGRADFQNKKYEKAYQEFDYYRQMFPADTTAMYATALAATNAGASDPKYYASAISNYNKLLTTNYSQNASVYYDLSSIYLVNKDTAAAMKTVGEGVAKYPGDNTLRKREIEIGLQSGKQELLLSKVEAAITADPKNKTLYYYYGLTYSQIADSYGVQAKKAKAGAEKTALMQKRNDSYAKAAEQYKKAVAIDPDYFEANLNLGYVLINPAIDEYNAANQLPANQQKQYDAAIAKASADFDLAKPYLQKAVDLNPKSVDALNNLKTYYLGKKDTVHANEIQKKIDALGN